MSNNNTYYYGVSEKETATIAEAVGILESKIRRDPAFTAPEAVKEFCRLQLAQEPDEYFCCLFMDNRHRMLSFERLFRGTIDAAAVYPRVVARRALEVNAAAVILTHNHPAGNPEPSASDHRITKRLTEALGLLDIRVLDHIVVGTECSHSMAEAGQL